MKKLLLIFSLFLLSCNEIKTNVAEKYSAENFNFRKYRGKTVENIIYCSTCGSSGNNLIIKFTDGKELKIWVYKYNMKIYK